MTLRTSVPQTRKAPLVPAKQRTDQSYRRRKALEPYLLIAPALLLLALVFLWPTLYNIWLSFHDVALASMMQGGTFVGLANYADWLARPAVYQTLFRTIVILTGITVALRIVFGLGLAVLYNSDILHRLRLVGLVRSLVLVPWVIPPVVAVAIFTWLYEPQYGIINKLLVATGLIDEPISFLTEPGFVWLAIISVVVWNELPFAVLMFTAGLQMVPKDLYEAARIDGAAGFQLFRYITLPMLRSIIIVVALLTTIWTYNNFVFVWLMTRGGPGNSTQVMTTQLYAEGFLNFEIGSAAAFGVIMSLVMSLIALAYYRFVVRKGADTNG
ncbi:carbohydrate ABC transporter permease [Arthrobacter castelli]|uniref:carbohydrate ABC transporter permease n=1 Tax=Arthrobacter castelli TaxID=271431 RepID=UPI0004018A96|nr:sugar ABC transporter permease [Arthrobacter castelli]